MDTFSSKSSKAHLIRLAQEGELEAFNRLVLEHQDSLYNLASRVLGDEAEAQRATQMAFCSAFQGLGSYRLDRWQARFWRAWLFRWLVQACRSLSARRSDPQQNCRRQHSPARQVSTGGLDLCSLPLDLRLVLALVDLGDLDYEEVALAFDVSPAKVKSRLARARQKLMLQMAAAG